LRFAFFGAIAVFLLINPVGTQLLAADPKPVLLYSRYFNAKGESRYLPAGTYSEILKRLGETFDVRVNDLPLTAKNLEGVAVVLVANPSDKAIGANPPPPHCTPADADAVARYVENGGGFIVMGNQDNHNLEVPDMNRLMAKFGMEFVSKYTDAKKLVISESSPLRGGLRWAYYTGNQLVLQSAHPAKPQAVVANDLAQKPLGGPRDEPGVLLASAIPGKGRVAAVTDSGWISNDALSGKGIGPVAIREHDNWEIFSRLARWAAHIQ